ncbi:MAG: chemotaxis response regulator protein-glutamate methylesterase [Spirochaetaceae bacterium]|jgi:two-component system chemotaxis response regulator CheB|nr:chemotaxis response regulator protein-glutamate methylesterase [Spirochaetaceae bacterium]
MADPLSVLIVDDSNLMRNLVGKMIDGTEGLYAAGTAANGKEALEKIQKLNPDVIVLDIEMPVMNGIEFLKARKQEEIKIPVVVLSSLAEKGASITMQALALGASDFVQKPSGSISVDINKVKEQVTEKLFAYGSRYRRYFKKSGLLNAAGKPPPAAQTGAPKIMQIRKTGKIQLICIGISTGGPDALRMVCATLDGDLDVPICIVQHMPQGFTFEFARTLDKICPLDVKEASDGDELKPGRILIAKGDHHLEIEKKEGKGIARLSSGQPVSGHRPSVDVLFASAALAYQNHVLGVIMTGMGKDGAAQLGTIYKEGGLTLGQDEQSSIVYGMPRVAYELGYVMEQVPLERMGQRISYAAKNSKL